MPCATCGDKPGGTTACPTCGKTAEPAHAAPPHSRRHPVLAVLFSAVIPGAGLLYLGHPVIATLLFAAGAGVYGLVYRIVIVGGFFPSAGPTALQVVNIVFTAIAA